MGFEDPGQRMASAVTRWQVKKSIEQSSIPFGWPAASPGPWWRGRDSYLFRGPDRGEVLHQVGNQGCAHPLVDDRLDANPQKLLAPLNFVDLANPD